MKTLLTSAFLALSLAAAPCPAGAAEVSLYYTAIERALLAQVFTQGGKSFLFGGPDSPCFHAALSNPRVSAQQGLLSVRLFFSGSLGREFGDDCVGLSDQFTFQVLGTPAFANGVFFLRDLRFADESRVPQFAEGLRDFVNGRLQNFFRFDVRREIDRLIEENGEGLPYAIALDGLEVPRITLGEDRLDLEVDFGLVLQ